MPGKPRVVGIRGFSVIQCLPPSVKDYDVVYSYDPKQGVSAVLSNPPKPPSKGLLSKVFPWLFK